MLPLFPSHPWLQSSFSITCFILNSPFPKQSLHNSLSVSDEYWFYAFICSPRITSDQQGLHYGLGCCSRCQSSSSGYWLRKISRNMRYRVFFFLFSTRMNCFQSQSWLKQPVDLCKWSCPISRALAFNLNVASQWPYCVMNSRILAS